MPAGLRRRKLHGAAGRAEVAEGLNLRARLSSHTLASMAIAKAPAKATAQPRRGPRGGFSLVELMIAVALIAALSAVAVPLFVKYTRRARTAEATLNLQRLYGAAVTYFLTEHADPNGAILARQFPASVCHWTPAQGSCCAQPGQRCAPSSSQWQGPSWQALHFGVDDPHYYSYSTIGMGAGSLSIDPNGAGVADAPNACTQTPGTTPGDRYLVEASADLNCNGAFSYFYRLAAVDSAFSVTGAGAVTSFHPLE